MKKTRDTKSILLRVSSLSFCNSGGIGYIVSILCYVHNSSQKPCRNLFHRWNAPANPLAVAKFQRHLDSGSTFEILYQFTDRCRWFHSDRDRMWYPGSLCTCTNEIQR